MADTVTDSTTPTPVHIARTPTDGQVDLELLEATLDYIRPAIQMDGGDIVLLGVEDGTVNLQMVGACGGCPMSMMTLKAGIERILTDRVPGVEAVNAEA
jgi:Fe-S cluster biogenesis protein NfuA